ncbi:MAG: FtsW/RodA/SpoVE family cell cycle protein, partial [Limisphaerales bacterium]
RVAALLVGCVLLLAGVGMVVLYSISSDTNPMQYVSRQGVALALGLVGAVGLAWCRPDHFKRLSPWLLALAVIMLVAVLIPGVGFKANGARRWFRLPGFQFQPSDFAKLALIVFLAHYGSHYQRMMRRFGTGVAIPGVVVVLFMGLLFLEPDWGTALLIGAVSIVMLLVAGARWYFVIPPLFACLTLVGLMLWHDPMRADRLYSWLHLEETKEAVGYQGWQARIALGSGGVLGKGLDQSTQKRFVPENRTDFIFAIIGEEFGFVGSLVVLSVFVVFFLCGLYIAWRAPDPFGMLLATGITFLIALQAFVNIGVVSSLLPNKGIALPFVSYGGSNLLIMTLSVGALFSVARSAAAPETRETPVAINDVAVTRMS